MSELAEASQATAGTTTALAFAWSIGVSAIAAAAQLLAFSVLRRRRWTKPQYHARVGRPGGPSEEMAARLDAGGPLGWLGATLHVSEGELVECTGGSLDAVVYLRLALLGVKLFSFATVLGAGLVAVNWYGDKVLSDSSTWLDELSIGHLAAKSRRFWASVLHSYCTSIFLLMLLWREYAHMNLLRQLVGGSASARPGFREQRHTVLVTDMAMLAAPAALAGDGVPPQQQHTEGAEGSTSLALLAPQSVKRSVSGLVASAGGALGAAGTGVLRLTKGGSMYGTGSMTREAVEAHFEKLYPGEVVGTVLVQSAEKHTSGLNAWNDLDAKLADAEVAAAAQPGGRDLCCRPVTAETLRERRVDANTAFDEAEQSVLAVRAECADPETARSHAAFVAFGTAATAFHAAHALMAADGLWDTRPAPSPGEVMWPSLSLRWTERYSRGILVSVALTAFVVLFMIPLTFVSGAANLTALSEQYDWLGSWYLDLPESVTSLIEGFLPSLILIVFFMLCPPLLYATASFKGCASLGDATLHVFGWMFAIMTVSVLWSTVAQALFSQASGLADALDFAAVIELLATGVPASAALMIQFVVIKTIGGLPGELLGIVPLLLRHVKLRLAKTSRQVAAVEAPDAVPYASEFPNLLLIIFIGLLYMSLQPLIAPFVAIGCALSYMVWKHQLIFVYEPVSETTGRVFLVVFSRVIVSLLLAQIVLLAVLFFGEAWVCLIVSAPLPFITYFTGKVASKRFQASFEQLPLDAVVAYDAKGPPPMSLHELQRAYQPAWLAEPLPTFDQNNLSSDGFAADQDPEAR